MTVLEDARHVAHKRHTCDICCGSITEGTSYNRQRVIGDDGPYTHRSHDLCLAFYRLAITQNDLRPEWGEFPDWQEDIKPLVLAFFRWF